MIRLLKSGLAAIAALAACFPLHGQAQLDYPSRVVQIVNPYQAGSTTDVLARGLAAGMSSRLGQQFVVINRAGAGGATGTASVARAEADGYTLLFAPALVVSVYPAGRTVETGYKADALVPVCQTFSNAMVLAVRADSPLQSVADLVKAAQAKPGELNYGHQGPATIPHLAMEEFLDAAKIKIAGIAYRGDPGVATDLIGGRLDAASIVQGTASANRERIRLLGIFAEERHPAFPDTPTVKEQGYDVSPTSFGGIMAPAGTPDPIVEKLERACEGAAEDEAYQTVARGAGQPANYYAHRKAFDARLKRDIEVKAALLARMGQQTQ
jgi:tripartite-type tricarboxylate transporter receptor subunit TctC